MLHNRYLQIVSLVVILFAVSISTGHAKTIYQSSSGVTTIVGDNEAYRYRILEDETVEIVEYRYDEKVVSIPEELDGFIVTAIGDGAFKEKEYLSKVIIPNCITSVGRNPWQKSARVTIEVEKNHPTLVVNEDVLYSKPDKRLVYCAGTKSRECFEVPFGIKVIDDYAFYSNKMNSIIIPDSVVSIGNFAFAHSSLSIEMSLPDSVVDIGSNPWIDVYHLSSISISPTHPNLAFNDGILYNKTDMCIIAKIDTLGPYTNPYEIPQGIKRIGAYAFYKAKLDPIVVPDSVVSIGEGAFYGAWMSDMKIPDGVETIEDYTFCGCSLLENISIPESINYIGKNAFSNCNHLKNLVIPGSVTYIGKEAFRNCEQLTVFEIPSGTPRIRDATFWGCEKLEQVFIPDSVQSIGDNAFYNCKGLKGITIPNNVVSIGEDAFYLCKGIAEIIIPNSVQVISYNAFESCYSLQHITIPSSVTNMASNVFGEDSVYFDLHATMFFTVDKGSVAEQYCISHGHSYDYFDTMDWLQE